MTKIYRIPTGQVEGNSSNETNTSEIRPYGEIGLFIGDNNKLELLMFDGVRTHRRSKVLNKGTFYGGDADSSDGAGLDTIKLIPDANQHFNDGSYGNDQYLIIDPTAPNHIHIRAGGTIDSSNADLFLGGENTNVKVSDTYDNVTIRTSDDSGGGVIPKEWIFDNLGGLSFPMGGAIEPAGMGWLGLTNGESGGPISILQKSINIAYTGQPMSEITLISSNSWTAGSVLITTQDLVAGTTKQWTFDSEGSLDVPGFITSNEVTGLKLASNYDVSIIADYTDNNIEWTFNGPTSTLIVPGPIKSKTNQQVGSQVTGLPYTLGAGADNGYVGIGPEWAVVVALGNLTGYTLTAQQTGSTIFTTTITQMRTDLGGSPAFQTAVGLPGYAADITFTLTSPDYVPASDNNLELEAGTDIWTFGANGTLMFPNSALVDSADSNIEFRGMSNFNVEAGGVVNIVTDSTDTAHSWQFGDDGLLTFPDTVSKISTLNPATSGGVSGLNLTGNTRTYIGITGNPNFTWDFRNFGLADYSTNRKPAIMLPGSSWIEEDLTNQSLNLGILGPLLIGSQDKLTLRTNSVDLDINGFTPLATYDWVFGKDGSLTFPDNTVQTTAYPGITNTHTGSSVIAPGIQDATRDNLSVRVTNNNNTLDVEVNYQNPDTTVIVSAYRMYPAPVNVYAGSSSKTSGNTIWDNFGNLSAPGDSIGFTFTDQNFSKVYRVTVIAEVMPNSVEIAGQAYCIIEQLR